MSEFFAQVGLSHMEIVELLSRMVIKAELFDEREIVEVIDPDDTKIRYCLCKNEKTERKEKVTRRALIERTRKALDRIANRKGRSSEQRIVGSDGVSKKS